MVGRTQLLVFAITVVIHSSWTVRCAQWINQYIQRPGHREKH